MTAPRVQLSVRFDVADLKRGEDRRSLWIDGLHRRDEIGAREHSAERCEPCLELAVASDA